MTMEKANVIKALEVCCEESCADNCPYWGIEDCVAHVRNDAAALLKAKANDKPTYHTAIIYSKRDNLLKWLNSRYPKFRDAQEAARIRAEYVTEREIQLILLVRHEEGKCICRIKCPINPLPIKGEFQCVSTSEMTKLLASMGWKYKEKIHSGMFK